MARMFRKTLERRKGAGLALALRATARWGSTRPANPLPAPLTNLRAARSAHRCCAAPGHKTRPLIAKHRESPKARPQVSRRIFAERDRGLSFVGRIVPRIVLPKRRRRFERQRRAANSRRFQADRNRRTSRPLARLPTDKFNVTAPICTACPSPRWSAARTPIAARATPCADFAPANRGGDGRSTALGHDLHHPQHPASAGAMGP